MLQPTNKDSLFLEKKEENSSDEERERRPAFSIRTGGGRLALRLVPGEHVEDSLVVQNVHRQWDYGQAIQVKTVPIIRVTALHALFALEITLCGLRLPDCSLRKEHDGMKSAYSRQSACSSQLL